jgi:hypothetical protein
MSISFGSDNAIGIYHGSTPAKRVYYGSTKVWPTIPSDMDFVYLANDFVSGGIPNKVTGSDMGNYLAAGTITKNGSGSNCYLSNGNSIDNYLYIDLTTARLNAMQATSSYYTFFVRAYQSSVDQLGALFCWRILDVNAYIYMIRCHNGLLQVHGTTGVDVLSMSESKVFKIVVNGSNIIVSDMEGSTQTVSIGSSRNMAARMTTFFAGTGSEAVLDRLYGIAGIARQTTAYEDTVIRDLLLTQD